jgi:hypothetical protein
LALFHRTYKQKSQALHFREGATKGVVGGFFFVNKLSIDMYARALLFLFCLPWLGCSVGKVQSEARPISHQLWDTLLKEHVSSDGWVDYAGLKADQDRLDAYLDLLQRHHPNEAYWSREEQLAYWINAYNAFTVKLIVDHYPVGSIKDIKNGVPFVNTVWDIKFIEIQGQTYDLNNIEHGIIRSQFEDPRIHFAVNCASVSCPILRNEAYTANRLDAQLDEAARYFLQDEVRNQVTPENLRLSKIFLWYQGDFKKEGKLIDFLNRYSPVSIQSDADIEYLDYNWQLNERKNKP